MQVPLGQAAGQHATPPVRQYHIWGGLGPGAIQGPAQIPAPAFRNYLQQNYHQQSTRIDNTPSSLDTVPVAIVRTGPSPSRGPHSGPQNLYRERQDWV
jgi:hypothetical protein